MWSSPAAGLRYLICPVVASGSQSAQLLADGHLSTQDHSPTLAASTDIHAHTHTHTSGSPSPHPDSSGCPGPLFLPAASSSHGPTLRDTPKAPIHIICSSSHPAASLPALTYSLAHPHSLRLWAPWTPRLL